ncbi:putative sodium/metabolite cotransporter BASS2, chloroplastic [Nicotiana tabacum]|uniref:Sodium/metabolite cotransporter BASS2, chloroplastic n=1 Tax=Nicotiana tabacum TaxID=4097 RepID=A0A1S3ZSL6_TOBAC|nr:probable sodium/metabolite cotransporter BASS2, chloroplastic [Nicotiana tomentosiformis]XP_016467357.1 PREDICTED: probable sodium/metabolite cotransporter BASS2, chloroplastic [Nicotiana tabacum]
MAISLCFTPLTSNPKHHPRIPLYKPINPITLTSPKILSPNLKTIIKCVPENSQNLAVISAKPRWENWLLTAANLFPVYVTVGGIVACLKPSTFSWFVNSGPTSYSLALWFIMLAMGLTLEVKELINLLLQRPLSILFGCAAQYTIMPALGMILSKILGLSPSISVGLILLACSPGGTASNVVTLIAQGDVPLSIVMTACTTIGAVLLTPSLTKILAGTYVPVDALKLSISTLQVVVAPLLVGSYMQHKFPKAVKLFTPFAPLLAVLATSLVASSIFSENVGRLRSSVVGISFSSNLPLLNRAQNVLTSEFGLVVVSVALLHFAGFFVGYLSAALAGFGEPQRRAVSIEVGMQNSALAVVLATSHFSSPAVALPAATSAIVMNLMGSCLGFFWRCISPTQPRSSLEVADKS